MTLTCAKTGRDAAHAERMARDMGLKDYTVERNEG